MDFPGSRRIYNCHARSTHGVAGGLPRVNAAAIVVARLVNVQRVMCWLNVQRDVTLPVVTCITSIMKYVVSTDVT